MFSFCLKSRFWLFRVISWIVPFVQKNKDDPQNHIYEEAVRVKRKVKTHFTTDAAALF